MKVEFSNIWRVPKIKFHHSQKLKVDFSNILGDQQIQKSGTQGPGRTHISEDPGPRVAQGGPGPGWTHINEDPGPGGTHISEDPRPRGTHISEDPGPRGTHISEDPRPRGDPYK